MDDQKRSDTSRREVKALANDTIAFPIAAPNSLQNEEDFMFEHKQGVVQDADALLAAHKQVFIEVEMDPVVWHNAEDLRLGVALNSSVEATRQEIYKAFERNELINAGSNPGNHVNSEHAQDTWTLAVDGSLPLTLKRIVAENQNGGDDDVDDDVDDAKLGSLIYIYIYMVVYMVKRTLQLTLL